MDVLFKLFGSPLRVKLMRIFFMQPDESYTALEVAAKSGGDGIAVRRELKLFTSIGLIKERAITQKTAKGVSRTVRGWRLDGQFAYADALRRLVLSAECMSPADILARLKGKGAFRLIILAGIFIDDPASRADMIIVGDQLKRPALEAVIRDIETRIGRELAYSVLSTKEFRYRLDMRDKFVRDVLDFPHKKILNKLGI